METTKEGELARLPDRRRVRIESRDGDKVTVKRVGGPLRQTLAVCRIDKLRPVDVSR